MRGPRPSPLANGNCCYSDADVAAVDATPVESLRWSDYALIFDVAGCAVLPEQRVWFLPHAFAYARREPDDALEFLPSLITFVADRSSPLDATLIEECRAEIRDCFRAWTAAFRVRHYDLAACQAKGWRLQSDDQVEHAPTCVETLTELCRYLDWIPLADELFAALLRAGRSDAEAAWFLELSRRFLESSDPVVRRSGIPAMANDVGEIIRAREQISETLIRDEPSPTYWRDLSAYFGF